MLVIEWNEETSYGIWAVFDLALGHRGAAGNPVQIPAELVFTWRRWALICQFQGIDVS